MLKVPDRDVEHLDSASDLAVTDLQAEGRVPEHLEQMPEVRPGLDELSQRCAPC